MSCLKSVDELSQDLSTSCLKKYVDELFCRRVVLFPNNWCLLDALKKYVYITDLTSAVKWEGTLSSPFVIKQGVRQGGVLSTGHYRRYNHPFLIENKLTVAKIG